MSLHKESVEVWYLLGDALVWRWASKLICPPRKEVVSGEAEWRAWHLAT